MICKISKWLSNIHVCYQTLKFQSRGNNKSNQRTVSPSPAVRRPRLLSSILLSSSKGFWHLLHKMAVCVWSNLRLSLLAASRMVSRRWASRSTASNLLTASDLASEIAEALAASIAWHSFIIARHSFLCRHESSTRVSTFDKGGKYKAIIQRAFLPRAK